MSLVAQAKLLRVLEERRFERLGGNRSIEVDFRLISATNRPLEQFVRESRFREDLYYRVNAFAIRLPSLRERPVDIPVLAQRFLARYCAANGLPVDAKAVLAGSPRAADRLSLARQHPRAREHRVAGRPVGAWPDVIRGDGHRVPPLRRRAPAEARRRAPAVPARDRARAHRPGAGCGRLEQEGSSRSPRDQPGTLYRKISEYGLEPARLAVR